MKLGKSKFPLKSSTKPLVLFLSLPFFSFSSLSLSLCLFIPFPLFLVVLFLLSQDQPLKKILASGELLAFDLQRPISGIHNNTLIYCEEERQQAISFNMIKLSKHIKDLHENIGSASPLPLPPIPNDDIVILVREWQEKRALKLRKQGLCFPMAPFLPTMFLLLITSFLILFLLKGFFIF